MSAVEEHPQCHDRVFTMAASARVAAKAAGWNQTADRDVWTCAGRFYRLTEVRRQWCWMEVTG